LQVVSKGKDKSKGEMRGFSPLRYASVEMTD
jgi:hypothetical protein